MKILTTLLSITLMVSVLAAAAAFHHRTVCRQEAWLAGHKAVTSSLAGDEKPTDSIWLPKCRISLFRRGLSVKGKDASITYSLQGRL